MSIVNSALQSVLSIRTNPQGALANASQAFTASANIAQKVSDALDRKLNQEANRQLQLMTHIDNLELAKEKMVIQQDQFQQNKALQYSQIAAANGRAYAGIAASSARNAANNATRLEIAKINAKSRVAKSRLKGTSGSGVNTTAIAAKWTGKLGKTTPVADFSKTYGTSFKI